MTRLTRPKSDPDFGEICHSLTILSRAGRIRILCGPYHQSEGRTDVLLRLFQHPHLDFTHRLALVFVDRLVFVASRIRRIVSLGRMPQDLVQHAVVGGIGDGKIHSRRKLGIAQRGTV